MLLYKGHFLFKEISSLLFLFIILISIFDFRYLNTLKCKKDCNFNAILKQSNNSNSELSVALDNLPALVPRILRLVPSKVKTQCRKTIGKYMTVPVDASALVNDIGKSIFSQSQFVLFFSYIYYFLYHFR